MAATITQAIGIAMPPTLAAIQDLAIYVLPVLGSMLLFYWIFQVISESKISDRKKLQDRLRGKKTEQKEIVPILRRGALGQTTSFADSIVGKVKFVPKLQSMLDQPRGLKSHAFVVWVLPLNLEELRCEGGCKLFRLFTRLIRGDCLNPMCEPRNDLSISRCL